MALIEYTLTGTVNKVAVAIKRLRAFEPPEGYYVAFSGGKDSVAIKRLCRMAKVKYDAHYNVTSVDPPELVRFIKRQYKDVIFEYAKYNDGTPCTMWNLIPKKQIPPTRLARYCCEYLKEGGGKGRITVTGVRWAESANRKSNRNLVDVGTFKKGTVYNDDNDEARRTVEQCYRTRKTLINPIIDWTDEDVWEFIRTYDVPYCELYDQGFSRLGCIGCPMNTHAADELERYPQYKHLYIVAFDRMLEVRKTSGKTDYIGNWSSGEAVMKWWLQQNKEPVQLDGQTEMEEAYDENQN